MFLASGFLIILSAYRVPGGNAFFRNSVLDMTKMPRGYEGISATTSVHCGFCLVGGLNDSTLKLCRVNVCLPRSYH